VAPLFLRAGSWVAGVAPARLAALQRRLGGDKISRQLGEAQKSRR